MKIELSRWWGQIYDDRSLDEVVELTEIGNGESSNDCCHKVINNLFSCPVSGCLVACGSAPKDMYITLGLDSEISPVAGVGGDSISAHLLELPVY